MQKRVYGIERECGLFPRSAYEYSDLSAMFNLFLPRTRGGIEITPAGSEFLAHCGRAKIDSGGHPEMMTPECGTVRDCVIWDKANERILEDIAAHFNSGPLHAPGRRGIDPDIRAKFLRLGGLTFLKNNAGPLQRDSRWIRPVNAPSNTYASWGSHLNILINILEMAHEPSGRNVAKYDAAYILGPFCFSSAWLTGSGMVWITDAGRLAYSLSQRLPFVRLLHGVGALEPDKPMFLLRDEALADRERYYRLQCSGLDSSVCEWQTYVPLGIMGLMLRMAEDHAVSSAEYCDGAMVRFLDELLKMKEKTLWWGNESAFFSFRGETHTAPSLHRKYYLEPILRYKASGVPWSDEEEDIIRKYEFLIELFERACSSLERAKLFAPYAGWAANLHYLMLPNMRQNGYSFASDPDMPLRITTRRGSVIHTNVWERLKVFDTFFHDVRRDKSFYHALTEHGLIQRIVTEDEILYAKDHAPSGTRAEARDRRIAELRACDELILTSLEWTNLSYRYVRGGKMAQSVIEYNSDPLSPDPRSFKGSQ